jgi:hypothetical protein
MDLKTPYRDQGNASMLAKLPQHAAARVTITGHIEGDSKYCSLVYLYNGGVLETRTKSQNKRAFEVD